MAIFAVSAVQANGLVTNGEFDQDVAGWGTNSAAVTINWDALDVDDAFESGSARVTSTETRLRTAVGLGRCVSLPGTGPINFAGAIYVPSAQPEQATVGYTFDWQMGTSCDGRIALGIAGNAVGTDAWEFMETTVVPPVGAESVFILGRITFAAKNDLGGAFEANFDAIHLPEPATSTVVIAVFGPLVTLCLGSLRSRATLHSRQK